MTVGVYSKQLSDGSPAGTIVGQSSTDLVGFYGTAGVVRGTSAAAVSTSVSILISSGYGFSTQAQADAIVTLVNALRLALVTNGMIG